MSEALADDEHVAIVGSGLAGWRLAEGLRREGFAGRVSLLGAERHAPYDRPPLSKQILVGKWPIEQTALVGLERLEELNVEGSFGDPATALDVAHRTVSLASGRRVEADVVVVATGVRARTLPYRAGAAVRTLRTRDDAAELLAGLATLDASRPVVVIGGGFIGAEVATSLHARGFAPIVLETMARPLMNVVGGEVANWLGSLPSDAGVDLRGDQQVTDVSGGDGDFRVHLAEGTEITAAMVILAVGAQPNTQWLEGSGLALDDGVVVDEQFRSVAGVYAIGDVARFRWRHGPFDESVRIEHWQVANDHASSLASILCHGRLSPTAPAFVPYFWSDQYGKKIQMLGRPNRDDEVTMVAGSRAEGRWLALYSRDGVVTAGIALSHPRALMVSRSLFEEHPTLDTALARAPWAT
jgi:NADPH-dependent 2,4-dienoyl-CoA reductase/sulfur reductase-like enzyme